MESGYMVVGSPIQFFPYACGRFSRCGCCKLRIWSGQFSRCDVNSNVYFYCAFAWDVLSFILSSGIMWLFRKLSPSAVDKYFRRFQLVSASAFSLGHGGNDAQKSMGIIWAALIVSAWLQKGSYCFMDHLIMSDFNSPGTLLEDGGLLKLWGRELLN